MLLRLPVPWLDWPDLVGEDGPIALGIDEHSFRGQNLVITITCLTTHRLVAILPDDRQATPAILVEGSFLGRMHRRIVAVCTDLKEAFRKVIQTLLPQATLVIDPFHLIQDANRRIEESRRLEQSETKKALPRWPLVKGQERLTPKQQSQLQALKAQFPVLAEQHWLKEGLRSLYRCGDASTAQSLWQRLLLGGENGEDAATVLWARTLRRWDREILGYFQYPLSNGYTEGCHTKIKLLKRLSYGFRNVQVYIRKMLLGFLPHSHEVLTSHILT